jgi:cytochrome b
MKYMVRVWDAPTRFFHWVLVVCVVGLVTTAQIGGTAMEWHFRLGYSVLALLLFRLVWGFAGGRWSRFQSFLYSPRQVLMYLHGRGQADHSVGHNPIGALSIFAMLGFLALQVGSGLMSDDEIAAVGPLVKWVSSVWVSNATFYHKEIGKLALLALVALHVAAIVFYFVKKHENLVRPMVKGDKLLEFQAESAIDTRASRSKALVIAIICIASVAGMLGWIG